MTGLHRTSNEQEHACRAQKMSSWAAVTHSRASPKCAYIHYLVSANVHE